jgi:aminoglycoside phosphotransferase (APT) family kinase protein
VDSASRPADEVRTDVPLVRRLVAAQFPQWAGLPVEPAGAAGFDNAIFRLGTDLAVRLPRRQFGADHLEREYRWLPVVGPRLPLAVPVPLGKGEPGEGYPWPWMVCSWLPGEIAALTPVADPGRAAVTLARFVAALRALDPAGAPPSDLRSIPLAAHDDVIRAAADALRGRLDTAPALAVWQESLAAPPWTGQPVWLHGDLHAANLLVSHGEMSGVIDFGLVGLGDPACDLMAAWTCLDLPAGRRIFRQALPADDATWSRARGWALQLGLRAAAWSVGNPVLTAIGRSTIAAVVADTRQRPAG